jgi:hypothetical protein
VRNPHLQRHGTHLTRSKTARKRNVDIMEDMQALNVLHGDRCDHTCERQSTFTQDSQEKNIRLGNQCMWKRFYGLNISPYAVTVGGGGDGGDGGGGDGEGKPRGGGGGGAVRCRRRAQHQGSEDVDQTVAQRGAVAGCCLKKEVLSGKVRMYLECIL